MKITGVKTLFADGGHRVFVFVKVETDQPGLVGWGEASLEAKPRAVAGCVADMEPMILGEDPCRIEYIWQILYRGAFLAARRDRDVCNFWNRSSPLGHQGQRPG